MTNIKKNLKSHIGPTKKTSALIKYLKTVLKQGGKKIDYFLSGKIFSGTGNGRDKHSRMLVYTLCGHTCIV